MVARRRRRSLLLAHAGVVDQGQRLVERRLVVAAVVGEGGGRVGVRELVGLDEVASADLGRIDADLAGQRLHRALERIGRLGSTGAAVGVGRRLVREHRRALEGVRRDVVDAAVEEGTEQRDARA